MLLIAMPNNAAIAPLTTFNVSQRHFKHVYLLNNEIGDDAHSFMVVSSQPLHALLGRYSRNTNILPKRSRYFVEYIESIA